MKKPKPPIRTLIVEAERDFKQILKLFPDSDYIRSLDHVELRLPKGMYYPFGDGKFNIIRLETK